PGAAPRTGYTASRREGGVMTDDAMTEGLPPDGDNLTLEKLRAVMDSLRPVPKMPRWKDLTWAQRNMVEREIAATESLIVREAMRASYYRDDDDERLPAVPGGERR